MTEQKPQKQQSKEAKAAVRSGDVTFNIQKTAESFSDWYDAIMDAAEIVDRRYPIKGQPVMRPYGFYMHNAIMRYLEDRYEENGLHQALFPTTIPESFLKKEKEHVKGFEAECYWVEKAGLNVLDERLALRPTSETAMYYMFNMWVRSFRDLPLRIHQTVTVFRYETKMTKPLIRVREIPWNEAHTCHATKEEALEQLQQYWSIGMELFEKQLGFTGQILRRAPWDKFAGAEHTEVLDVVMPDGRVLQTAGIHYLGQKFAKVFDIKFTDNQNKQQLAEMTCAGFSTRVLACALSIHGDSKGLVLPPLIAQYQVVIIPCGGKKEKEVIPTCLELQARLRKAGVRAHLDQSTLSMGEKLFQWEMKGVPLRIELGPRDLEAGHCIVVPRDVGKEGSITVKLDAVESGIREQLDMLMGRLETKAEQFHKSHVTLCDTKESVIETITKVGGFAKFPFYSMENEAKEAEATIKEACGAEIRGYWPEEKVPEGSVCALTGKPATVYAYAAKAY